MISLMCSLAVYVFTTLVMLFLTDSLFTKRRSVIAFYIAVVAVFVMCYLDITHAIDVEQTPWMILFSALCAVIVLCGTIFAHMVITRR